MILTICNFDSNYDSAIWSESRRIGSPRCWPQDSSDHSDQSGHRDSDHSVHSGEHRDSGKVYRCLSWKLQIRIANDPVVMQNRAVPAAVTAIARTAFIRIAIIGKLNLVSALISCPGYPVSILLRCPAKRFASARWSQMKRFFEGTADTLPSRKSSSSTDSCVSAHSRSGSESAGGGVNKIVFWLLEYGVLVNLVY